MCLLLSQAGKVVTRDDIRAALWPAETFVDYDQGVNFAMKQVREASATTPNTRVRPDRAEARLPIHRAGRCGHTGRRRAIR